MDWIFERFSRIIFHDFEFQAPAGEAPAPVCLVAKEVTSKGTRTIRLFGEKLLGTHVPPFDVGPCTLVVAYYASAEWGCFLELGWPLPARSLDLYAEFRALTSGKKCPHGYRLLGAAAYFGLPVMAGVRKSAMRERILYGAPFTDCEQTEILGYCEDDVDELMRLFECMQPEFKVDKRLGQGLFRGRFTQAIAVMERRGVPVDMELYPWLLANGQVLQKDITSAPAAHGLWENGSFSHVRFEELLTTMGLNAVWPRTRTGMARLDKDTMRDMSGRHPVISELSEVFRLVTALAELKLGVGLDGRTRCLLSPFGTKTGRCGTSSNRYIFGLGKTIRPLIKPRRGTALAVLDYSQQEFAIGGVLSGDKAMQSDYESGDPYLALAIRAGAAPLGATAATHTRVRDQYKRCVLAVQYGAGARSLGAWLGIDPLAAEQLLRHHRRLYHRFWTWQNSILAHFQFHGRLETVFGWPVHVDGDFNPRSVINFPMQANGAEILRLACIWANENGIDICAPVHDAVLIEAPLDGIEQETDRMHEIMVEAGRQVLDGFELRVDSRIIRYPDRYPGHHDNEIWSWLYGRFEEEHGRSE